MSKPNVVSVADCLESYIRERFQVRCSDRGFTRTVNLWDAGYIDSIGLLELVAFMEATFAISLPEDALFQEDRRCVNGLAQMIADLIPSESATANGDTDGGRSIAPASPDAASGSGE